MVTQESYHAVNLISQVSIASLVPLIELANYGMLPPVSALKLSVVIMMKFWMPLSIVQVINLRQLPQMVWQEYTMYSLELVRPYCKVTKMKYLKFNLILKATRLLRLVAIRLAEYGTLIRGQKCKF